MALVVANEGASSTSVSLKKVVYLTQIHAIGNIIFYYNLIVMISKCLFLFICWFRGREREYAGEGQRERGRENLKQDPHCQCAVWCEAWSHEPWDPDLSRNQESDIQPTEPPGSPSKCLCLHCVFTEEKKCTINHFFNCMKTPIPYEFFLGCVNTAHFSCPLVW